VTSAPPPILCAPFATAPDEEAKTEVPAEKEAPSHASPIPSVVPPTASTTSPEPRPEAATACDQEDIETSTEEKNEDGTGRRSFGNRFISLLQCLAPVPRLQEVAQTPVMLLQAPSHWRR